MADQLAQLRGAQYQPMPQQMPQVQPQQAQVSGQSMVWVNGEQEAMGYLVAPNSAVALWDSNAPTIYLKQADASGKLSRSMTWWREMPPRRPLLPRRRLPWSMLPSRTWRPLRPVWRR